jgi:hypothetical protein
MQKGDLVVVPPKSFIENAYLGELVDEPRVVVNGNVARYGAEPLPGRRVKSLAQISKRELPFSILEALQKPNAVFLVERSLRSQFYQATYGNYSIDDFYTGRFEVTSENFNTHDDVLLQAFFNFAAANTRAVAESREGDVRSFKDAAFIDSGTLLPNCRPILIRRVF